MSGAADAGRRRPLSVAWRDWIAQEGWAGREGHGPAFDAIVVGSGYGGSVAVLRLARKGLRVLLLERGSEYLPGEFPNDFSGVPKYFRINNPLRGQPLGRASGLVEVHLGQGMVGVTGNGLGGGSLVNAGVLMQPDADVFAQPAWPAAIRGAPAASLQAHFDTARRQLRAFRWDGGLPAGAGRLAKSQALQGLGEQLRAPVRRPALTIDPARCLRCGDCAAGCNVPGAKQSLPASYLSEALATGRVQIVTQAEAYRFERWEAPAAAQGAPAFHGWRLQVFATDAQQQFVATRELFGEQEGTGTARWLHAPLLFVCAGAFGSTQLLQRSQARAPQQLAFSPALGTRVSGNGDSFSWLVNERDTVGALGRGQAGTEAWQRLQDGQGQPGDAAAIVGPTITAALDLRRPPGRHGQRPRRPLEQRLVVQDGAAPRALAPLYRELLATMQAVRDLDGWWTPAPRYRAPAEDPLAPSEAAAQHAQMLLVMGHDGAPGRMLWLEGSDRSAPVLDRPEELATYRAQQALFDRMGRRHVHNPLWRPMPRVAQRLMSGPKPPATVLTVHPLGGCPMGDGPETGVVNHLGQVWAHDAGRFRGCAALELPQGGKEQQANAAEPRLYRGLYVLDGAIVPTALGCNPLWTITALAERALAEFHGSGGGGTVQAQRDPARSPVALPSREVPVGARLHEVLQGRALQATGALEQLLGQRAVARLQVRFRSPDLAATLRDPRHPLALEAELKLGPDVPGATAMAVYRTQREEGRPDSEFEALPATAASRGPLLLRRAVAELALLLAASWWLGWPAWPLVLLLAPLLPFSRTVLTWFVLRGRRDIGESLRSGPPGSFVRNLLPWGLALARQLVHASEKRTMSYCVPLVLATQAQGARLPGRVTLYARKTVMYRASLRELAGWLRGRGPLRATFWDQVMHVQARLEADDGPVLLRGMLRMGFENLTASGLSSGRRASHGALELEGDGDTTSGTLALAGYPLLFLRHALKTRLLDFRLPTYSELPVADNAPPAETALRIGRELVQPERIALEVPRGDSNSDRGDESTAPLALTLWRYARRRGGRPVAPEVRPGRWMGVPVRRAKSVLLLHAFGQSGLSYTLKTVRRNLAESFYKRGYEVWVLETRMSTRSGLAAQPCTVDQMAQHDIPVAVEEILRRLRDETGCAEPLQIAAFGQCVGAAALWMSLLAGHLSHKLPAREGLAAGDGGPMLSRIWSMVSSQVHPLLVGGRTAQSKTWMPALLHALWRDGAIPFAVRGPQQGLLLPWLDRIFGSMPAPAEEGRPWQGHDDAAATCRRIRYIEAPLFRHENLNAATFGAMNLLFGEANLRLFAQARRFLERERLVDEDGGDRYVHEIALRRHAAFPVQLLHGADNELFDAASASQSFHLLGYLHPGWQERFCIPRGARQPGHLLVPGYGHLDVLIGQRAALDVFPGVLHFFHGALAEAEHAAPFAPARGWVARPPRIGPFVGWLREEGGRRLRVSLVVDSRGALADGEAPPVLLRFQPRAGGPVRNHPAPPEWQRWTPVRRRPPHRREPQVHDLLWADIPLQGEAADATQWEVYTLHPTRHGHLKPLPSARPSDEEVDAYFAQFRGERGTSVEPPLSDGGHPFEHKAAAFSVPAQALDTLSAGAAVRFGVGSCRHPGLGVDVARVDRTVRDFVRAQAQRPSAFALLLGDQIYADATAGLLDPASPLERFAERHEVAFGRRRLGELLACMPVYMTPDDHEFTDGWPLAAPLVRGPWPDARPESDFARRQLKALRVARRAVTGFQRLQSPAGASGQPWYAFAQGCVRVFVFDTRSDRRRSPARMVRPQALDALCRWLDEPQGARCLNVVASGSVALPGLLPHADPANPGPVDSWQQAPAQRRTLLQALLQRQDRRFLLLSGDYHVSGAMLVQLQGRTRGAAVIAPPLYAPLPYANATPEAVWTDEPLWLDEGRLALCAVPQGEFARGSGVGELHVQPVDGGFEIRYRRMLRVWESGGCPAPLEAVLRV